LAEASSIESGTMLLQPVRQKARGQNRIANLAEEKYFFFFFETEKYFLVYGKFGKELYDIKEILELFPHLL
jgi:hypothetical protein